MLVGLAPLRPPSMASGLCVEPAAIASSCGYNSCDYSRLSGVTHLRPSGSGVLQPLNLLCEAFAGRKLDSPHESSTRGLSQVRMTQAGTVIQERRA